MLETVLVLGAFVVALALGVKSGNQVAMAILLRLGLPVVSVNVLKDLKAYRRYNPDVIGWLFIYNICYAPIMTYKSGYYLNHLLNGDRRSSGELCVLGKGHKLNLDDISLESGGDGIKDLTIIYGYCGNASRSPLSIREARFTYLKRYVDERMYHDYPVFIAKDDNVVYGYDFLFAVEWGIDNREKGKLRYTDRDSFLAEMRKKAYLDTGGDVGDEVVILAMNNGVDMLLVFLNKRGVVNLAEYKKRKNKKGYGE